jgi:uncharacterized heparinase superfamily protein
MALADQSGSFGMALSGLWRRLRRSLAGSSRGRVRVSGPAPERLLLAPPDLHTPDPTVAQEIYAGIFHFAGKTLTASGGNPFTLPPPSPAFAHELHSFGWLRHLGAAGDPLSATNAQALIKDWIEANPRPCDDLAWDAETSALRLVSWLSHSVLIVEKTDLGSYRRFLKSIGYHIRYLRSAASGAPDGMPRLLCLSALAYADICVSIPRGAARTAQKQLDTELARQILPDGGHVSRNPAVLVDLLALLLPLRQSFVRVGQAPSTQLVSAIDRMMLAVRFYRLGDGGIARFNGGGHAAPSLISTVLRYDDVMGALPGSAPYSGYQRLEAGGTILLMETGKPPPPDLSSAAHAGTLSFEMTSGEAPLIVNCGVPALASQNSMLAGRSTAAHSTMTLNDTSSSRFVAEDRKDANSAWYVASGPARVPVERREADGTVTITASHDGYARAFGVVHERHLRLSNDGAVLTGMDRFHQPSAKKARAVLRDAFVIRFHLHPSVEAHHPEDGEGIALRSADGALWDFACEAIAPQLEEGVYFAVAAGSRRSLQIVLRGNVSKLGEVGWSLTRRAGG